MMTSQHHSCDSRFRITVVSLWLLPSRDFFPWWQWQASLSTGMLTWHHAFFTAILCDKFHFVKERPEQYILLKLLEVIEVTQNGIQVQVHICINCLCIMMTQILIRNNLMVRRFIYLGPWSQRSLSSPWQEWCSENLSPWLREHGMETSTWLCTRKQRENLGLRAITFKGPPEHSTSAR